MPYSGVAEDNSQNLSVAVFWREPILSIGLDMGAEEHIYGQLYREKVTNGVSIVIFR